MYDLVELRVKTRYIEKNFDNFQSEFKEFIQDIRNRQIEQERRFDKEIGELKLEYTKEISELKLQQAKEVQKLNSSIDALNNRISGIVEKAIFSRLESMTDKDVPRNIQKLMSESNPKLKSGEEE